MCTICEITKTLLQEWVNKQNQNRCWYYPEIFKRLLGLYKIKVTVPPDLPPRSEFESGCERYQDEEYGPQTDRPARPVELRDHAKILMGWIDQVMKENPHLKFTMNEKGAYLLLLSEIQKWGTLSSDPEPDLV